MDLAVVYLARVAEGLDAIDAFVKSYQTHDAGAPHQLVIICKGATALDEWPARAFGQLDANILFMDDLGFDIHAYLAASQQISHPYACFLNTFSQIERNGWLGSLYSAFQQDGVGLVGACGTYESVVDSLYFHVHAFWHGYKELMAEHEFRERFRSILEVHRPDWLSQNSTEATSNRWLDKNGQAVLSSADCERFLEHWFSQISGDSPLSQYASFPRFPNPHVRTNAFLMAVADFVAIASDVAPTKVACLHFENGVSSLTNRMLSIGKQVLVVGADGTSYPPSDWKKSRTFRVSDQSNLLVSDNQTRFYMAAPDVEKENLRWCAWGEEFPASARMKSFIEMRRESAHESGPVDKSDVSISIVIPTHNRLDLVKQAIQTVVAQAEGDWELVVFDNASDPPIEEHISAIQDSRVRCVRSSDFIDVTSSWNAAFDLATGEYVMMIGDDDGLCPNYFSRIRSLIGEFGKPDLIYFPILQFFHPGVAPWQPRGYVNIVRVGSFFEGRTRPFYLTHEEKETAIKGSLELRRNFFFNMQALLFKKSAADSLRVDGKLFQSPFPDYYIANVAIYLLDKVLVAPFPVAIAGVSRASFGFTLFNNEEARGGAMLKTKNSSDKFWQEMKGVILAGPAYATNYIITMRHVHEATKHALNCKPAYGRYRKLQILASVDGKYPLHGLNFAEKTYRWVLRQLENRKEWSPRARRMMDKIRDDSDMAAKVATQLELDVGGFDSTETLYRALEAGLPIQGFDGPNRWIVRRPSEQALGAKLAEEKL